MLKTLIFLTLLLASATKCSTFHGDQVVRVTSSTEDVKRLNEHENFHLLDVWKIHPTLDVQIPANHVAEVKSFLVEHEIPHEVLIENVQELISEQSEHPRNIRSADERSTSEHERGKLDKYLTYEETEAWVGAMATKYPDLLKVEILGKSYEGRNLTAVYFNYREGNDLAFINCGYHAREWIGPAICLATIDKLVEEARVENLTNIPRNLSFIFIPIANPDGYAYSMSTTTTRWWRKTRSKFPPSVCQGVDPNRNFDIDHCGGESTSNDPCEFELYCGPKAFSEKCTAAQRDLMRRLTNVKLYIDVHSYGEYIFYPYAYRETPSSRQDILKGIVSEVSDSIFNSTGHRYQFGTPGQLLYAASGTGLDYFFERENVACSFVIESRGQGRSGQEYGFALPYSESDGAVQDFWVGLQTFVRAVTEGKCEQ